MPGVLIQRIGGARVVIHVIFRQCGLAGQIMANGVTTIQFASARRSSYGASKCRR
jgi:hypothetical protein